MYIDEVRAYSNDASAVALDINPPRPSNLPTCLPSAGSHSAIPARKGNATTHTVPSGTFVGTSANDYFNDVYGVYNTTIGELGDDTYVVADERLDIYELPNQGTDTVMLWADYRLPPNVENAIAAAPWALTITGNALANILIGSAYDDYIVGAGGDDMLTGGKGNDFFYFQVRYCMCCVVLCCVVLFHIFLTKWLTDKHMISKYRQDRVILQSPISRPRVRMTRWC